MGERYLFERKAQHNMDYVCTLDTKPPIHVVIQKDRIDRLDVGTDIRIVNDKGDSIFSGIDKSQLKTALESGTDRITSISCSVHFWAVS